MIVGRIACSTHVTVIDAVVAACGLRAVETKAPDTFEIISLTRN